MQNTLDEQHTRTHNYLYHKQQVQCSAATKHTHIFDDSMTRRRIDKNKKNEKFPKNNNTRYLFYSQHSVFFPSLLFHFIDCCLQIWIPYHFSSQFRLVVCISWCDEWSPSGRPTILRCRMTRRRRWICIYYLLAHFILLLTCNICTAADRQLIALF